MISPIAFWTICSLYIICSLALLGYGIQCYIMTYLFLRVRKSRIAYQHDTMKHFDNITDESAYPLVVTQLPMYNEKTVARRIMLAAAAMEYPRSRHEIQVLDDSNDETLAIVDETAAELRAQGVNISVVRRPNRVGFKAGALQYGLEHTQARYVAIFDADFVPPVDFLLRSVSFFINRPKLGLVQGRWTHLNRNSSLLTRGQAMGIDGHFMIEQAARSWNGLFMNFNGTAGIFRREAIETSGGWHHDTLTEDMDLSYRMQLHGWETEYVPDIQVPAEIPEDINAFKNQQFRWAKGSIQTAIKIIPMLKQHGRLSFFKKLQAVLHLTHYMVHPLMLVLSLLTMPVLFLVHVYLSPVTFFMVLFFMLIAASGPSTLYVVSQHYIGNSVAKTILTIPAMMLIGTGLAVNNGKAVFEALINKKSDFLRTPKKGEVKKGSYKPLRDVTFLIEIGLGIYCLVDIHFFFGYHNVLVSPFLVLYAAGFLFVGVISFLHHNRPELISMKIRQPKKIAA